MATRPKPEPANAWKGRAKLLDAEIEDLHKQGLSARLIAERLEIHPYQVRRLANGSESQNARFSMIKSWKTFDQNGCIAAQPADKNIGPHHMSGPASSARNTKGAKVKG